MFWICDIFLFTILVKIVEMIVWSFLQSRTLKCENVKTLKRCIQHIENTHQPLFAEMVPSAMYAFLQNVFVSMATTFTSLKRRLKVVFEEHLGNCVFSLLYIYTRNDDKATWYSRLTDWNEGIIFIVIVYFVGSVFHLLMALILSVYCEMKIRIVEFIALKCAFQIYRQSG